MSALTAASRAPGTAAAACASAGTGVPSAGAAALTGLRAGTGLVVLPVIGWSSQRGREDVVFLAQRIRNMVPGCEKIIHFRVHCGKPPLQTRTLEPRADARKPPLVLL